MTDEDRKKLDDHDETLYGTERHPEIGLVTIVKDLSAEVAPIIKFWKDAKWPVRLFLGALSLALTGWLVEALKTVLPFLRGAP